MRSRLFRVFRHNQNTGPTETQDSLSYIPASELFELEEGGFSEESEREMKLQEFINYCIDWMTVNTKTTRFDIIFTSSCFESGDDQYEYNKLL